MPYRLSALAERDIEEIWSYVAEDASPTTADRLINTIVGRFSCSSNSLTWVDIGPSSVKAFGRSLLRATLSTIGTTQTS